MPFNSYFNQLFKVNIQYIIDDFLNNYKGRAYHNEQHIMFMLKEYDKYKHTLEHPMAVLLAILYHDIIYDTQACSMSNEIASAKFLDRFGMCDFVDHSVFFNDVGLAKKMIIDTATHEAYDPDSAFMMDIDLLILAMDSYDEYDNNIRKEYSWVDDETFKEGRSNLLKRFLQKDKIFQSLLYSKYEDDARENIKKLIIKYS